VRGIEQTVPPIEWIVSLVERALLPMCRTLSGMWCSVSEIRQAVSGMGGMLPAREQRVTGIPRRLTPLARTLVRMERGLSAIRRRVTGS
jgi:hypothetical protein